ncbi:STAS domain-containing protein [Streptomyces ovatisporus]|uniref:STAS domain-containing protein n=1 Tax=Streptomyces ovatisporus TaxID=1128682 RepID=UPI0036DDC78E
MTTGDDAAREPGPKQQESGADGAPSPVFRERRDGTEVLTLSGDLDLDVVDEITPVLDAALAAQPDSLVIDLSGVTFADSSALNMLLRTHARTSLHLGGPLHPVVRRLFEITGIESVLNLHDSPAAALQAAARTQR